MRRELSHLKFAAWWVRVFCLAGLLTASLAETGVCAGSSNETAPTRAELARSILPGVVSIMVRKPPEAGDTQGAAADGGVGDAGEPWKRYYGSGFVIDPTGIIVTNKHVIDGARAIVVEFNDGTSVNGTVMAAAIKIDLALIKVRRDRPLPVLKFGDSDRLRVGDPVLSIGNPLGIGVSVSSGIVSALNRDIKDGPYDDFIQTDAALNHGNSGGPLVNAAGEVVGIDTALYSNVSNGGSIGLGFAITANDAQFVISRLLKGGHVAPGWIGLGMQDATPAIAEALGLEGQLGAIVTVVHKDAPGEKAGLQQGDILLQLGDDKPADARAFMRVVARQMPGRTVPLSFWRDGAAHTIQIAIANLPGDRMSGATVTNDDQGGGKLQLSPISETDRQRYNLKPGQAGVMVRSVAEGASAAVQNLLPGDVIMRVQTKAVASPEDVEAAIVAARAAKRDTIVMLVLGKNGQSWLPLQVDALR